MKSKINILINLSIVVLSVFTLAFAKNSNDQLVSFKKSVDDKTSKVIVYESKDGYTPVKGIDYTDGKNGINAVSYSYEKTIVKEVPLIGEKGEKGNDGKDGRDGIDAPTQQIRVNPDNFNIQTKLSNWDMWSTLVYCSEYRLNCPESE